MGIVIPFPNLHLELLSMQWFRMHAEFATDPKIQCLNETFQRRFVMFLCLQCTGEFERLSLEELAFALRIEPTELQQTIDAFKAKGFLDENGKIRNWNKRQYKSDSSTERVRKHRLSKDETLQKRSSNGHVTPSETDTDSEKNSVRAAAPPSLDASLFAEGKQIFGQSAGGMLNRAIRAKGKPWLVGIIETCRSKDPEAARAYLSAALNRSTGGGHERAVI